MAASAARGAAVRTDLEPWRRGHRTVTSVRIDHPPAAAPVSVPAGPVGAETPQPVPAAGVRWLTRAGEDPDALAAEWSAYPSSAQRLRTGHTFGVVDAPAGLGLAALAKTREYALGLAFGPIAVEGDRLLFLVDAASISAGTRLLPARDDAGTDLHLRLRGAGAAMVAGPIGPQQGEQPPDCWWLLAPTSDPPALPAADEVVRVLVATANAALREQ